MSHYSVAVFTKPNGTSLEELLAPYDENIEVAPYIYRTKAEIIETAKKQKAKLVEDIKAYADRAFEEKSSDLQSAYWLEDTLCNPRKMSERYANLLACNTDEEFYRVIIFDDDEFDAEGNQLSTYNPDSKWDWYCEGGRWSGTLRTKDNEKVDTCLVSELDLSGEKDREEMLEYWGEKIETDTERKEYILKEYGSKEAWLEKQINFSTFAFVTPDGEWFEPGKMGWWAMDTSTEESCKDYYKKFDDFLKNADPNWAITIVDCHI